MDGTTVGAEGIATARASSDPLARIGLPEPVAARAADLPTAVAAVLAAALDDPPVATETTIPAAGIPFHVRAWGDPADPPLLLVHGVTASSAIWWRVGPALAAAGFRVVAPDLPGHGGTGGWSGRRAFRETAADLAAFIRAADLDRADLRVVGHSWGAVVVAALPAVGLAPDVIVLVDPPVLSEAEMAAMLEDPTERRYDDPAEAVAAVRTANPTWTAGDVAAKAEALTLLEKPVAREVLAGNGDWDGGLADLAHPAATRIPVRVLRGEPPLGGLMPDATVPAFVERLGTDAILTIRGGGHSPMRTHPEATVLALLRLL